MHAHTVTHTRESLTVALLRKGLASQHLGGAVLDGALQARARVLELPDGEGRRKTGGG